MATETVEFDEMEETETEVSEEFRWQDHTDLFPAPVETLLMTMLTNQDYGWKRRVRMLERMAELQEKCQEIRETLIQSFTPTHRGREKGYREVELRELRTYRALIGGLSPEALKVLADEKNVSYDSYMKTADREGLFQAILEETVPA